MRINKIFKAIKGDGQSQGRPATFVIIGGENEKEMDVNEIYKALNISDNNLIVFDGIRDPLMYQHSIIELIWLVSKHNKYCEFEIETRGMTSFYDDFFRFAVATYQLHFNVSPSLLKSLEDKKWVIDTDFIKDIYTLSQGGVWSKSIFKFSVKQAGDFIGIGKFCEFYKIPHYAVWISGGKEWAGYQLEDITMISSHCLANNYNYSLDLRTDLYVIRSGTTKRLQD